jgi:cellulose biosynthesis protein BcsQ
MKIIATYNIKGGVGKTAAAVNLAWFAAQDGFRTLVWDLDPQGAATFYFRVKPKVKGGGKKIVEKKSALSDLIRGTDFEMLDLLPADFSYRHLDILLEGEKKPTRRLRQRLKTLSSDYDLILLDCPPSISLVSEAVFQAADLLLVPIIPTTLSLRTLEQLYKFRRKTQLDDLPILPFFSMADRRKLLHREVMEALSHEPNDMLKAFIPYVSDIEKMGLSRAPLGDFAPRSRGFKAFQELWTEVRTGGYLEG